MSDILALKSKGKSLKAVVRQVDSKCADSGDSKCVNSGYVDNGCVDSGYVESGYVGSKWNNSKCVWVAGV